MTYRMILVPIAAYLLGNFNSGIIFSWLLHKKDLRQLGSKNPGTTNAFRVLGRATGILVLFFDALKGIAAVALANWLLPGQIWPCIAGFFVVLGHIFPVLFKFKGGKGVATTAGVTLFLQPPVLLLVLPPFFALLFGLKYMSVAAMVGTLLLPFISLMWFRSVTPMFWLNLVLWLFIVFTHRENIKRLLRHEENKLFQKKK